MSYITKQAQNLRGIKGIQLSVTKQIYSPLTGNKIKNTMSSEQYDDFCIWYAGVICEEIAKAITKQRYASNISKGKIKWKPLTIKYRTWKARHHLSLNIWEATGLLKKSLKVYKRSKYLVVGFQPYDRYKKSHLPINTVAKFLEFGTVKMPPRPLFRTVLAYVRRNIDRYLARYYKELKKSGKTFIYVR